MFALIRISIRHNYTIKSPPAVKHLLPLVCKKQVYFKYYQMHIASLELADFAKINSFFDNDFTADNVLENEVYTYQ